MVFSRFENTGFGEMSADRFRAVIDDSDFRAAVQNVNDGALCRLEQRTEVDKDLTYQEFVDLVGFGSFRLKKFIFDQIKPLSNHDRRP